VFRAGLTFRGNGDCVEAALAGGFEPGGVGAIRDHDGDAGIGYRAGRNAVGDGDEVGAASGEENAEVFHGTQ